MRTTAPSVTTCLVNRKVAGGRYRCAPSLEHFRLRLLQPLQRAESASEAGRCEAQGKAAVGRGVDLEAGALEQLRAPLCAEDLLADRLLAVPEV